MKLAYTLTTLVAVTVLGSAVHAQDWAGTYAGVQAGSVVSGDTGIFKLSPLPDGGALATAFSPNEAVPDAGFFGEGANGNVAGLHFGYDWQSGNLVYGGVVSVNTSDIQDKQQGKSRTPAVYTIQRDLDSYATVLSRVGYVVRPQTLVYATAGLAIGDVNFSYSQPGSRAVSTTSGDQDNMFGYAVGLGVENRLTDRVSIGLEYNYINMGGNDFAVNLAGGPFSAVQESSTAVGSDNDFDFGQVQVKISYRF